jgi:hypothetical protein
MSRYLTPYTNTGTAKFTTLVTGAASAVTTVTARRITVLTGGTYHFMAIGTGTVAATTGSMVLPANSCLDFNMTTGTHVAVLCSSGASSVTILDAD